MIELKNADFATVNDLDLGSSEWLPLDQERINEFAAATGDRQWIHVDVERAKAGPFGGTIAHGYLVLSVIPKLLFDIVTFSDAKAVVNYGIDKLRFLSPVPSGGEVRLKARLQSAQQKANGWLLRFRGEVELRASGRRALLTDILILVQ